MNNLIAKGKGKRIDLRTARRISSSVFYKPKLNIGDVNTGYT